jgi:hypothetical protein
MLLRRGVDVRCLCVGNAPSKIATNFLSAMSLPSPTRANGLAGCGLTSAYVNCFAASVSNYLVDWKGSYNSLRKNPMYQLLSCF